MARIFLSSFFSASSASFRSVISNTVPDDRTGTPAGVYWIFPFSWTYLTDPKEKKVIQHFSDLLINGELTAEDLLPDILAILTRCGFQIELAQIKELMDDIEYDAAAQIIKSLFI